MSRPMEMRQLLMSQLWIRGIWGLRIEMTNLVRIREIACLELTGRWSRIKMQSLVQMIISISNIR